MNVNRTVLTKVICVDLKGEPTYFAQTSQFSSHAENYSACENTRLLSSETP